MLEEFLSPLLAYLGIGLIPFLVLLCLVILIFILIRG